MKCATFGCPRDAEPGRRLCTRCRARAKKPQTSLFPGAEASEDIRRQRLLEAPPLQRSASLIEYTKVSRKRKVEDDVPPLKRAKSGLDEVPATRHELPILFVPFEGNFANRMIGGYSRT